MFSLSGCHTYVKILTSCGVSADAKSKDSSPAHHDGLFPPGHNTRDVADNNGLAENGAVQNVSYGPIGAQPHLLQIELLHARLVRCYGCALNSHTNPLLHTAPVSVNCSLILMHAQSYRGYLAPMLHVSVPLRLLITLLWMAGLALAHEEVCERKGLLSM